MISLYFYVIFSPQVLLVCQTDDFELLSVDDFSSCEYKIKVGIPLPCSVFHGRELIFYYERNGKLFYAYIYMYILVCDNSYATIIFWKEIDAFQLSFQAVNNTS